MTRQEAIEDIAKRIYDIYKNSVNNEESDYQLMGWDRLKVTPYYESAAIAWKKVAEHILDTEYST